MAGPIGYTPPANAYSAMPIDPGSFHGLNPLPAQAAATQAMAPIQAKIDASEAYDTQAQQAAKFQRLLQSGQQGMQAYIQDVGKADPQLAATFNQEFQGVAPFMQNLKGKELTDLALNMYDSWNGRVGGSKMSSFIGKNPDASMSDVLSQAGGNVSAKDQASIYGQDLTRQSNTKYTDAKIEDLKNKPGQQIRLQQMKDDARIRSARIRAAKDVKGAANMQYTYNGAKDSFDELTKQIDDLSKDIAKDPMIAKFEGNQQMLIQLRRERTGWQKAMQRAVEKGASATPDKFIPLSPDIDLGQGTDPATAPAAPGGAATPPGAAPEKPSSASPDSVLTPYLQAAYPDVIWTPERLKQARNALTADEAQGVR